MRKDDVEDLLCYIKKQIIKLEEEKIIAEEDENIRNLLKVEVKSVLENLRSCLDYIAVETYEKILGKKKGEIVYFPYSRKKDEYIERVQKGSLKELSTKDYKVYKMFLDVQPFKCKEFWLVDLCELTNSNKHNTLTEQNRYDRKRLQIGGMNIVDGLECVENLVLSGNTFNGVKQKEDLIINRGKVVNKISDDSFFEIINSTTFKFKNKNIEIISFLNKCFNEIMILQEKFFLIRDSKY